MKKISTNILKLKYIEGPWGILGFPYSSTDIQVKKLFLDIYLISDHKHINEADDFFKENRKTLILKNDICRKFNIE